MNKINFATLAVTFLIGTVSPSVILAACNSKIIATTPDDRFTNNGDNTVTDKITGLMWKQCSEGQSTTTTPCDTGLVSTYKWQAALQRGELINTGSGFAGYTDWRLPNRNELASLVERQCYSPSINTNLFPHTLTSYYFSSSPNVNSGSAAWAVDFDAGDVWNYQKGLESGVRLVRGGL